MITLLLREKRRGFGRRPWIPDTELPFLVVLISRGGIFQARPNIWLFKSFGNEK